MKKRGIRTLFSALLIGSVLAAAVAIAADVGSQGDPLVTLSYLRDVFTAEVLGKTDEKLAQRNQQMTREMEQKVGQAQREIMSQLGGSCTGSTGGTAETYTPVMLAAGQSIRGAAGCEVLLRSGNAVCAAENSAPGLVDVSEGGTLGSGGSLKLNHLYMMSGEQAVRADNDVTVLIRGTYTVE